MPEATQSHKALELSELAEDFSRWNRLPEIDRDSYGAFAQLASIYKFAIANYNEPGVEMLLEALFEAQGPSDN
ncbi:hypothetical protein [Rhodococcus koreensis]|uniref:hypothetical protein n=1 Tax=Rhodococcus koreensis TaxID=99653 RepID=UPI0036DE6E36